MNHFHPGDLVECIQDGNTTAHMVGWVGEILSNAAVHKALDYFDEQIEIFGHLVRYQNGLEMVSKPSQLRLIPKPGEDTASWDKCVWRPSLGLLAK